MRASIWVGPWMVVLAGSSYAITWPRAVPSLRAATQAIMFGRDAGTIGWTSTNSGWPWSGRRIST